MAWVKSESNAAAGWFLVALVVFCGGFFTIMSQMQGCESHNWREADRIHRAEPYQQYLDRFPNGRHADEARARLKELQEVDAAWATLQKKEPKPTNAELEAFIVKYPKTDAAREAGYVLKGLRPLAPSSKPR